MSRLMVSGSRSATLSLQAPQCALPCRTTLIELALIGVHRSKKGPFRMPQTPRLEVGDKAPAFSLPDGDGNAVKLSDYKGRRVIVYFYPAAATPGCTKQACDFRDSLSELNGAGLDVIGISPDKPAKLAKFRDDQELTFPLLSDPDRKVLTAWGPYGQKTMYGKTVQGVIRSTFVVDEKGKISEAQYNVRATGHVAKLRRDLAVWSG